MFALTGTSCWNTSTCLTLTFPSLPGLPRSSSAARETRIEIGSLKDDWTRGMARNAQRSITSICSPFGEQGDFSPTLEMQPENGWLEGLLEPKTAIEQALFRASGTIHGVRNKGNFLTYDYEFTPPLGMNRVEGRTIKEESYKLPVIREDREDSKRTPSIADHNIGDISFKLFIFDRDPHTLSFATADRRGLRQFLNQKRRDPGISRRHSSLQLWRAG